MGYRDRDLGDSGLTRQRIVRYPDEMPAVERSNRTTCFVALHNSVGELVQVRRVRDEEAEVLLAIGEPLVKRKYGLDIVVRETAHADLGSVQQTHTLRIVIAVGCFRDHRSGIHWGTTNTE